jgi:hypothetical protein
MNSTHEKKLKFAKHTSDPCSRAGRLQLTSRLVGKCRIYAPKLPRLANCKQDRTPLPYPGNMKLSSSLTLTLTLTQALIRKLHPRTKENNVLYHKTPAALPLHSRTINQEDLFLKPPADIPNPTNASTSNEPLYDLRVILRTHRQ